MKQIRIITIVLSVVALTSSCVFRLDAGRIKKNLASAPKIKASQVYVTKDTTVAPFSQITVSSLLEVSFVQDPDKNSVSVYASDNILPYVKVTSENGWLEISLDPKPLGLLSGWTDMGDVKVVVNAPSLSSVYVAGSSTFSCSHLEISEDFDASVSGSGEMSFGTLSANSTSFGVAGSGEVNVETLRVKKAEIEVHGSGEICAKDVNAGSISASVAGSGELDLAGRADSSVFSVAGSGEIDAKNLVSIETVCTVSGSGSVTYRDADGKVKTADKRSE